MSKGELSLEHAGVMMDALRRAGGDDDHGVQDRLKAVGKRLKAAVAKGEMTEGEAWAKWAEINKEGDRDVGIEGHYKKLGVSEQTFDRIRIALNEGGLTGKQTEQALGGMLRGVHEVQSEGERVELDPRLRTYFKKEVGLTDKQIELVQGLACRIVHGMRDSNHQRSEGNREDKREGRDWDAIKRRIEGAVERGDLTREEADAKYREIRARIAKEDTRRSWRNRNR